MVRRADSVLPSAGGWGAPCIWGTAPGQVSSHKRASARRCTPQIYSTKESLNGPPHRLDPDTIPLGAPLKEVDADIVVIGPRNATVGFRRRVQPSVAFDVDDGVARAPAVTPSTAAYRRRIDFGKVWGHPLHQGSAAVKRPLPQIESG